MSLVIELNTLFEQKIGAIYNSGCIRYEEMMAIKNQWKNGMAEKLAIWLQQNYGEEIDTSIAEQRIIEHINDTAMRLRQQSQLQPGMMNHGMPSNYGYQQPGMGGNRMMGGMQSFNQQPLNFGRPQPYNAQPNFNNQYFNQQQTYRAPTTNNEIANMYGTGKKEVETPVHGQTYTGHQQVVEDVPEVTAQKKQYDISSVQVQTLPVDHGDIFNVSNVSKCLSKHKYKGSGIEFDYYTVKYNVPENSDIAVISRMKEMYSEPDPFIVDIEYKKYQHFNIPYQTMIQLRSKVAQALKETNGVIKAVNVIQDHSVNVLKELDKVLVPELNYWFKHNILTTDARNTPLFTSISEVEEMINLRHEDVDKIVSMSNYRQMVTGIIRHVLNKYFVDITILVPTKQLNMMCGCKDFVIREKGFHEKMSPDDMEEDEVEEFMRIINKHTVMLVNSTVLFTNVFPDDAATRLFKGKRGHVHIIDVSNDLDMSLMCIMSDIDRFPIKKKDFFTMVCYSWTIDTNITMNIGISLDNKITQSAP